jgi:hypothetical protein
LVISSKLHLRSPSVSSPAVLIPHHIEVVTVVLNINICIGSFLMAKIVSINYCDECPYFNNEYWGFEEQCTKLNKKIDRKDGKHIIPKDCPLQDDKGAF